MRKILIFGFLAGVLLSACAGSTPEKLVSEEQSPLVTVYRSPT